MKKKLIYLMSFVFLFALIYLPKAKAVETVPCGNAIVDKKKAWFSTNCKPKNGATCLLRCDGPLPDTISL
ncbi:MAG: hypothetical protein ACQEW9_11510 [Bacteroidota bacterium]|jgi:hypothetical protein